MEEDKKQQKNFRCPTIECCPFFTEIENHAPQLVKRLQGVYCFRDNTHCARMNLGKIAGKDKVPSIMMPNQSDWAKQILIDEGKIQEAENFDKE